MPRDARSIFSASFALCGFVNISCIAILAGGYGAVAPALRAQVASYGLRGVDRVKSAKWLWYRLSCYF